MKTIVITGSTRGIGFGLADAFLDLGCAVVVSGRSSESVKKAFAELATRHEPDRVFGFPCDVRDYEQVQALWDAAKERFEIVDIWINNAGLAHPQTKFWEQPAERMEAVVGTNLLGAMYGAKAVIPGMLEQGFGSLYFMEGAGSDGRHIGGLTLYSSVNPSRLYLAEGLADETRGTPVLVGSIRPGMVITDMITRQFEDRPEELERVKGIFNIIADRVETVAPWLARKILENNKHGARITWLTRWKLMRRFLLAPFRKRDLFS
jgi:NAD(P)-dependent dehydrogenase (short-subunit alcohol dehydrogenase family)